MHELMAVLKIVSYSLFMIAILLVMTLSLLSILSHDIEFGEGTIELRKGRISKIFLKLSLCGVSLVFYFIVMVLIR